MHGTPPIEFDRIAIVFCSHDRVHAGWAYDMVHLTAHFVATGGLVPELGKRFNVGFNWCQTSLLAEGRQRLAEDCKAKGAKKILWVDTDMRFPRQALHMLLRHDLPIVGANYVSRRPPFRFTAATLNEEYLDTKPNDKGLVEVAHMGFGCVLTDISVYWDEGPWFAFDWYFAKEEQKWKQVGEDVFFFREARIRGHKAYVDQELSAAIGHVGEFTFTPEEMAQVEAVEV